jgi:hypothetical protein
MKKDEDSSEVDDPLYIKVLLRMLTGVNVNTRILLTLHPPFSVSMLTLSIIIIIIIIIIIVIMSRQLPGRDCAAQGRAARIAERRRPTHEGSAAPLPPKPNHSPRNVFQEC